MTDSGLKAVFLAEQPMLLRLLTARLGNRADAEDALQDMWLKLDQQAGAQPVAQPAAYLYRMASNQASDRRIAATRAGARDTAWLEVQPAADEQPTIEQALLARERLARLEAALAAMPARASAALRMYRLEDLPQKEIAERLGMTLSGVEKLLRRAIKELQSYKIASEADSDDPHRLSIEGESHRGR
ncbi:RNA polymerase sigma factor [Sphingomonas sp. RB3P16]|uniref:RNA polymerase sigma factor n=1 Tax=Parasphingomonas frigoris TaxID=3096163 RepID=UPI002FC7324F